MLFTNFASGQRRLIAIGGAILFTLFLLYDFNRLAALDEQGVNDWETALQIAVSLYLDIINLLLELLEATSNWDWAGFIQIFLKQGNEQWKGLEPGLELVQQ